MTDQKEPPKSYKKKLKDAKTKEERAELVRKAMEDGHTNKSAAEALGVSPGAIAGIRNRENIPSKHDAPRMGKSSSVSEPELPRLADGERPKLAASEATQCVGNVDGIRCAYERLPGKYRCALHIKKR